MLKKSLTLFQRSSLSIGGIIFSSNLCWSGFLEVLGFWEELARDSFAGLSLVKLIFLGLMVLSERAGVSAGFCNELMASGFMVFSEVLCLRMESALEREMSSLSLLSLEPWLWR